MALPNIWGQGSIFAFSSLDGISTFENSLSGTLLGDKVGILFHTATKKELFIKFNDVEDLKFVIVASDIIKANYKDRSSGEYKKLCIVFASEDTVIGYTAKSAYPIINSYDAEASCMNPGINLHKSDGEFTVLNLEDDEGIIRFSFSYSKKSEEDALKKANRGLNVDIDKLVADKINFYCSLPQGSGLDEIQSKTLKKCFSIMKSQCYSAEGRFKSRWTTPDRVPHKRLWLWDSIFHSIGNKYIVPKMAYESIKAVFDTQREDGFIPHFADPNFCSNITQPPVIAWGLYDLYSYTGKEDILKEQYERLKKYLLWNIKNRDSNHNYLFEWEINSDSVSNRCDESGMDNSTRFDNVVAMDTIDFSCFMANEAKYMSKISDIFKLEDEKKFWDTVFKKIKAAVNDQLWDDETHFYYDRILASGKFKKIQAVSSFLPLFSGICDEKRAKYLVDYLTDEDYFGTTFPVPSISKKECVFGTDMWRGPVWINYNYMIIVGLMDYGYIDLARSIAKKTIEVLAFWYQHDGVIYEFYDPNNIISPSRLNRKASNVYPYDFNISMPSIRDYGWSACLYVALVLNERLKINYQPL